MDQDLLLEDQQILVYKLIHFLDHQLKDMVHLAEGYQQDPVSQTHSEIKESFIQLAGQIQFALGSPVVLHLHLSLDIPTKYYGSFGHLQPQKQFDSIYLHESYGTQELELVMCNMLDIILFLLLDHLLIGICRQSDNPVSQKQSNVIDPFTQQAGHQPFPARGSPVDKHSHLVLGIPIS
ncbi:MAG: hypothetical protein EZS28_028584 [Streblomastix strix]|uniref:Uncharacterized protein n=1 Tax=Streblomastix strix TaxID=222440 RepID=A0A5J4UZE8_9EUKA|nr:MAG: hypothetical protein EZS28_028584 [Streblomastix strix]